jgi:hypothetical protein
MGPVWGKVPEGKAKGEDEGGVIWWVYFAMCTKTEQWKLEIVLRRGEGGWGRMMEGVNLIKIHYKHMCKCHNETPLYNYMLKKNPCFLYLLSI